MIDLGPLYPHPNRVAELARAQAWDAVCYALDGWRDAATGTERAYFRRLGLFEIRAWKRWIVRRPL